MIRSKPLLTVLFTSTTASLLCGMFLLFSKFGLLSFGGGYVLVPLYIQSFVGSEAPYLQLSPNDFANFLGITQITPGPVSVNAATFFGFRMAGVVGSIVATIGLLLPSFFLMIIALRSLERWKRSRIVQGILRGVAPASIALMLTAMLCFMQLSIYTEQIQWRNIFCGGVFPAGFRVRPLALIMTLSVCIAMRRTKIGIVTLILICAALGAVVFPIVGL